MLIPLPAHGEVGPACSCSVCPHASQLTELLLKQVIKTTWERTPGLDLLLPSIHPEEWEVTAGGNSAC